MIQYRRLSEIEACFRANKHDLKIRPIFHWRDRRIRTHIAICYMAFCCLQHLRHRLAARGRRMSPDRIRRAPHELEISILCETGGERKFGMPSGTNPDAGEIYRTLGLTWNRAQFVCAHAQRRGAAALAGLQGTGIPVFRRNVVPQYLDHVLIYQQVPPKTSEVKNSTTDS